GLFEMPVQRVALARVHGAVGGAVIEVEIERRQESAADAGERVEPERDERLEERGRRERELGDVVALELIRVRERRRRRRLPLRERAAAREALLDRQLPPFRVERVGRLVAMPRLRRGEQAEARAEEIGLAEVQLRAAVERGVPRLRLQRARAAEEVDVAPVDRRARLLLRAVADAEVHLPVL